MGDAYSVAQLIRIGGLLRSELGGGRRRAAAVQLVRPSLSPGASLTAEHATKLWRSYCS